MSAERSEKLQKCPVCDGAGHLNRPPWVPGDQTTWSASEIRTHECKTCDGKGVLLEPFAMHNAALARERDDALRERDEAKNECGLAILAERNARRERDAADERYGRVESAYSIHVAEAAAALTEMRAERDEAIRERAEIRERIGAWSAQLTSEIVAAERDRDHWKANHDEQVRRKRFGAERSSRLEAALHLYGRHLVDCPLTGYVDRGVPVSVEMEARCECGLIDALRDRGSGVLPTQVGMQQPVGDGTASLHAAEPVHPTSATYENVPGRVQVGPWDCICGGVLNDGLPRLDVLCPVCDAGLSGREHTE